MGVVTKGVGRAAGGVGWGKAAGGGWTRCYLSVGVGVGVAGLSSSGSRLLQGPLGATIA